MSDMMSGPMGGMGGGGGGGGGMGGPMGSGGGKKPQMSASKKHPMSTTDPTMTPQSMLQGLMKQGGSLMGGGGSK